MTAIDRKVALLTEDEARAKWCPFARLPHGLNRVGSASLDDGPLISAAVCCIASVCMAWRWNEPWRAQHPDETELDNRGFCGLAGRILEL